MNPQQAEMTKRKKSSKFGVNTCVLGLGGKEKLPDIIWQHDITWCDILHSWDIALCDILLP